MNVYRAIREEAAGRLDGAAVIDGDRGVSYRELFSMVDGIAEQLASSGVAATDRVALSCEDGVEYIATSLAILSLGAAVVPVSPSHSRDELNAALARIDTSFLISDGETPLWGDAPRVFSASSLGRSLFLHRRAARGDLPEGYRALNPAFIRFSSGTTGASKGVVLSHETILERTDAADRALHVTRDDKVIWVLSMSHHFVVSILLFLRRAATIVLCGSEFPASLVSGLVRHRGTFVYASPFHYRIAAGSASFSADHFANVRLAISTAMRLPASDAERFRERFGIELAEAYGIIEVGLPFVNRSGDPAKRGSVGSILPDYEARIARPDAQGVGEVYLRGKGMFDAYYSPWRTRDQALEDGWFRTGDLGRLDPDGFLFLAGRADDVINFAGMKIFPDEVEAVLNQHPLVRESRVYPVAHPHYGELPSADLVLQCPAPAEGLDAAEIRRFCYRFLAPYKVPKQFRFVPHLAKTASGKIKRWKP
jgi:long-chain acyl-CoA synthetase